MQTDRITHLRNFIKEEPEEPFNYYALALELKDCNPQEAKEHFDYLLQKHPDYTATYYHAAALYEQLALPDDAKGIYEKGITVCQKAMATHALRELQTAYQNFCFEYDL